MSTEKKQYIRKGYHPDELALMPARRGWGVVDGYIMGPKLRHALTEAKLLTKFTKAYTTLRRVTLLRLTTLGYYSSEVERVLNYLGYTLNIRDGSIRKLGLIDQTTIREREEIAQPKQPPSTRNIRNGYLSRHLEAYRQGRLRLHDGYLMSFILYDELAKHNLLDVFTEELADDPATLKSPLMLGNITVRRSIERLKRQRGTIIKPKSGSPVRDINKEPLI